MVRQTRALLLTGCLALVLAGCFQQAGSAALSQGVSRELPAELPSAQAPQAATLTPAVAPRAADASFGQAAVPDSEVALLPSETPSIETPAQHAAQGEEIDPLLLTATAIRLEATQTEAANQTATQNALTGGVTEQPTLSGPPIANTVAPFATSTTAAPLLPGTDCVHEVQVGENLFRISLRYGVTIADIAARNGIVNINLIVVGDQIVIPGCGTTGVTPPPTSIPQTTPIPGSTTTAPVGGRVHTVQQGETLFQISLIYGVTVNAIAAANGITNINVIFIGQQLVIP